MKVYTMRHVFTFYATSRTGIWNILLKATLFQILVLEEFLKNILTVVDSAEKFVLAFSKSFFIRAIQVDIIESINKTG